MLKLTTVFLNNNRLLHQRLFCPFQRPCDNKQALDSVYAMLPAIEITGNSIKTVHPTYYRMHFYSILYYSKRRLYYRQACLKCRLYFKLMLRWL